MISDIVPVWIDNIENGFELWLWLLDHGEVVAEGAEAGLERVVVQATSLVLTQRFSINCHFMYIVCSKLQVFTRNCTFMYTYLLLCTIMYIYVHLCTFMYNYDNYVQLYICFITRKSLTLSK